MWDQRGLVRPARGDEETHSAGGECELSCSPKHARTRRRRRRPGPRAVELPAVRPVKSIGATSPPGWCGLAAAADPPGAGLRHRGELGHVEVQDTTPTPSSRSPTEPRNDASPADPSRSPLPTPMPSTKVRNGSSPPARPRRSSRMLNPTIQVRSLRISTRVDGLYRRSADGPLHFSTRSGASALIVV